MSTKLLPAVQVLQCVCAAAAISELLPCYSRYGFEWQDIVCTPMLRSVFALGLGAALGRCHQVPASLGLFIMPNYSKAM